MQSSLKPRSSLSTQIEKRSSVSAGSGTTAARSATYRSRRTTKAAWKAKKKLSILSTTMLLVAVAFLGASMNFYQQHLRKGIGPEKPGSDSEIASDSERSLVDRHEDKSVIRRRSSIRAKLIITAVSVACAYIIIDQFMRSYDDGVLSKDDSLYPSGDSNNGENIAHSVDEIAEQKELESSQLSVSNGSLVSEENKVPVINSENDNINVSSRSYQPSEEPNGTSTDGERQVIVKEEELSEATPQSTSSKSEDVVEKGETSGQSDGTCQRRFVYGYKTASKRSLCARPAPEAQEASTIPKAIIAGGIVLMLLHIANQYDFGFRRRREIERGENDNADNVDDTEGADDNDPEAAAEVVEMEQEEAPEQSSHKEAAASSSDGDSEAESGDPDVEPEHAPEESPVEEAAASSTESDTQDKDGEPDMEPEHAPEESPGEEAAASSSDSEEVGSGESDVKPEHAPEESQVEEAAASSSGSDTETEIKILEDPSEQSPEEGEAASSSHSDSEAGPGDELDVKPELDPEERAAASGFAVEEETRGKTEGETSDDGGISEFDPQEYMSSTLEDIPEEQESSDVE